MKQQKRRSVLCLILVLLQVFFVFSMSAIAADDAPSEGVALSLSKTTLEQDLTAEVVAEKDALYIEGQKALSLVAFSAEANATMFDLYFYLFSPRGFDDLKEIKLTLTEDLTGSATRVVEANILDRSKTLLKISLFGMSRKMCGYDASAGTLNLKLSNYMLTYDSTSVTYPAMHDTFDGSVVNGYYTFVYNLKEGILQSSVQTDILELQVTLASERVSSSDAHTYKQINTAMMLIPESYFIRYGDIELIEYIYTLYDKVPMLVTTTQHLVDHISAGDHPSVGFFEYYNDPSASGSASEVFYSRKYTDQFVFKVDSIRAKSGDYYDVTTDQILAMFYANKADYNSSDLKVSFQEYIGASSVKENIVDSKDIDDEIKTESYEKSAEFWQKLIDGRLSGNIDDSVNLNAIHVLDGADLSLSDEKLSELYCIDEVYVPAFRNLASKCKIGYRLVLMRYLVTDYTVYDCKYFVDPDKSTSLFSDYAAMSGYVAQNAIIENFQILKIQYVKKDVAGNVVRTTVYPDNPETDYSGGLESGGALEDDVTQTPDEWWQELLNKFKSIGEILRKIFIAILITLGVFLILRLIARIRDAFGRRYPREDKPPRERRRRK